MLFTIVDIRITIENFENQRLSFEPSAFTNARS